MQLRFHRTETVHQTWDSRNDCVRERVVQSPNVLQWRDGLLDHWKDVPLVVTTIPAATTDNSSTPSATKEPS